MNGPKQSKELLASGSGDSGINRKAGKFLGPLVHQLLKLDNGRVMSSLLKVVTLLGLLLLMVAAQDDDFGGGGGDDGGYGGYDGGDGGFGGGGGGGGDDGGFVGGDGGFGGDGGYDGTEIRPVYASPEMMTGPTVFLRKRRSLSDTTSAPAAAQSQERLRRVRRGGYGVVGPVYTYVKTDYDGNFKWGARHHVGKSYGGHHGGGGYGGGY